MKKAAGILGLLGAGLVIVVIVLVPLLWTEDFAAFVFNPLVGALIGVALLSVPVMAILAVAYGRSRPGLSVRLYFVATGVGLLFLLFVGLLLTRWSPWACVFVVPVLPLAVAGALLLKTGDRHGPRAR